MLNQEAPTIEFPCPNYPVKVVGKGLPHYDELVSSIVRKHAPDVDLSKVNIKDSRNGKFRSLTFHLVATGTEQLEALHRELMAQTEVHMVI